jgi:ribose 5-phosphate isomerase RpiB
MNEAITKIHLATDHAGFSTKEAAKDHLDAAGYTMITRILSILRLKR